MRKDMSSLFSFAVNSLRLTGVADHRPNAKLLIVHEPLYRPTSLIELSLSEAFRNQIENLKMGFPAASTYCRWLRLSKNYT